MPQTVNGVGTHYYGKKNTQVRHGVCHSCGHEVDLMSYDTGLYVVVLFIPVIPLGKKRIVDYCPRCTKHYVVPLKKWQQQHAETLDQVDEQLRQQADDPEELKEAIGHLLFLREEKLFEQAAQIVTERHNDNVELLILTGRGYLFFNKSHEAERFFRMSLDIGDDPEIKELLACLLIGQEKPDQAHLYLQHILQQRLTGKVGHLIYLAQGYQAIGEHQKALDVLDQAEMLGALTGSNKGVYKKTRKTAERYLMTSRPIGRKAFKKSPQFVPVPPKPVSRTIKYGLPALVLIALAVYLFAVSYIGRDRTVYFVNGLDRAYSVLVNNRKVVLDPMRAIPVSVAEGPLAIKPTGEGPAIPEFTCEIHTPFLIRPFVNRTWVVNPDQTAPLLWEKIWYAVRVSEAPESEEKVYVGQTFYSFKGIDYAFREFPDEIQIEKKREARYGLRVLNEPELQEHMIDIVSDYLGPDAAVDFVVHHMLYEPENPDHLYMLYSIATPEQFIRAVRHGLDAEPVRIEWHRLYQQTCELGEPEHDLETEYRVRLNKEPENPVLQYLYGRALTDPIEAEQWFLKSTKGNTPCAYGYAALSFYQLMQGKYEQALEWINKAVLLSPENGSFDYTRFETFKALEQWDDALEHCNRRIAQDANDLNWFRERICLLGVSGKSEEARQAVTEWLEQVKTELEDSDSSGLLFVEKWIRSRLAYAEQDLRIFANLTSEASMPTYRLEHVVSSGKPADPNLVELLEDPFEHLLLYVYESRRGNPEQAVLFLDKSIDLLEKSYREQKEYSRYLVLEQGPDPSQVCLLSLHPSQKRIALAALGIRFPQDREVYFSLAERLNFDRNFPYLYLQKLFQEAGTGP
ncbi:MAG: hypothetical protein JXA82_19915 [Sedimentisphaerales bacterium]|nr:hypothetical protein [Sedimentisphaerales bacterium]